MLEEITSLPTEFQTLGGREWTNDNVCVWRTNPQYRNDVFQQLVPLAGKGCDVTVIWNDPMEGANELVSSLELRGTDGKKAVEIISESLEEFQNLVKEEGLNQTLHKARIVATRGKVGTKCPRFHFDHVPVRFVQPLLGRGCTYAISEEGVDRSILNQADDCNTDSVNNKIVDPNLAKIRQGREGEAVILRGREACEDKPAIHKSPELAWWEGRVVMILDVVS
jgi:hypothetical protein